MITVEALAETFESALYPGDAAGYVLRLELTRAQASSLFEDLFVALFKDTEGEREHA